MRAQQRKFDDFREEFNQVRPHEAIGMKRPAEIYQSSRRAMPKRIETYDYPGHYLVRRVSRAGTIRVFHKQIFISNTLQEDYVGLERKWTTGCMTCSSASITLAVMSCKRTRSTILCLKWD